MGRQLLIALGGLVKAIQRALRTVVALATKLGEHQDQLMRWKSARLDRLFELDEARRQRGAATTKAKAWTKAHGWRVMTSKVLGPNHDGLRALRAMEQEAVLQDRMVQDIKSAQLRIGNEVDLLTQEEIHLQVWLDRAQVRLQEAVERFVVLDHQAVPALLAVLTARRIARPGASDPSDPRPGRLAGRGSGTVQLDAGARVLHSAGSLQSLMAFSSRVPLLCGWAVIVTWLSW